MEPSSVLQHFFSICDIPHGSGNEQALAEHVMAWAMHHGLTARQDAAGNVFVHQPVTEGVADERPTVLLQAHLDMVCEKRPNSTHDFGKDPIPYKVEGDFITTGGETSLGADDGIGVALAMALLEEAPNHPEWPALEALFTVMEEEDLSGALNADLTDSKATFLINLDHTADNQVLCGSCGGMEVDVHIPLKRRDLSSLPALGPLVPVELRISGLLGGHSGDDIDKNRGNANVFLGNILRTIQEETLFTITDIQGGSFRLAIPRDASCTLLFPETWIDELEAICRAKEAGARYQLGENGRQVKVECHVLPERSISEPGFAPEAIIEALTELPDGVFAWNKTLPNLVDASDNLGEVRLVPGKGDSPDALEIILEIRAALEEQCIALYEDIRTWGEGYFKGTVTHCNEYPGWAFRKDSPLQRVCIEGYESLFGEKPSVITMHCGLEPGCLLQHKPDLDAVSLGPNIWDLHSVSERLSISSVEKTYTYLQEILRRIPLG